MLQRKTLHVYVSNRFLWILLKTLSHDFLSLTQASMMKMTSTTFLFFTFFFWEEVTLFEACSVLVGKQSH